MSINLETNDAILSDNIEVKSEMSEEKVNNKHMIYKFFKRILDIIFGLIGTILLVPIIVVVFVITIFSKKSRGPLFYSHTRLGKNGKHFNIYKFRTMIVGADEILEKYLNENKDAREEFEANQKLENDPRITPIGNFLRKTSLDEFPQFINVLKGDMSLIGPRPIVDREVPLFGDRMPIVHSVKPGITGYWAANGRSNTTYEERIAMEAYYAENVSLWLDIKVFFATIVQVIRKEGAV